MSLDQAFTFIRETEKLKAVDRQTYPIGMKRHENSAEHSWSLALAAMTLVPEIDPNLNLLKIIQMLLIHDLVEIDAGDTFCYGDQSGKVEAEDKAAQRIFSLLPLPTKELMMEFWVEFESKETKESLFANALDRMFPMIQNINNHGGSWVDHGICKSQVIARNKEINNASNELWQYANEIINSAVSIGWLKDE